MTPASLALRVLKLSGITSFSPTVDDASLNKRGIVTGDIDDVLACMNAANLEVCENAPAALTELAVSEILRAPTIISVTVTQYSKAVTVTGWQAWMESCTVQLAGDPYDNRLESATALLAPYNGPSSGTVQGTVLQDALLMDANVLNILEPISIPDRSLWIAQDESEYLNLSTARHMPYSNSVSDGYSYGSSSYPIQKRTGTPICAFADSQWDAARAYLPLFLRFNPAPDRTYPVRFRAKRKPKPFVLADLYAGIDYVTDPGTIIPANWIESILLPVTTQRWTAHPSCIATPAQLQEIARQYGAAMRSLEQQQPRTGNTRATFV